MPNRILKESICTSEDIDALSASEEVFFYRLIVNCDDYGRFDARDSILKARLYPLKQLKSSAIKCYLKKLSDVGMILLYKNSDKEYLQVTNWEKHQQIRNKRSKYPAFNDENSIDINCNQLQSNVTVIQSNPNPNTNSLIVKVAYAENVSMKKEEYDKLVAQYTKTVVDEKIVDLSLWKLSKGKQTKSDYATLLVWLRKDVKQQPKNVADRILRIPRDEDVI